jgi:catechol 2,3-dioxygenase-like lactoylglutathione lyase family enzyme
MIDHVSLNVADLGRARGFYDAALKPLGYQRSFDLGDASGYGPARAAEGAIGAHALPFWIGRDPGARPLPGHLCFSAADRAAVDAFHAAALAAGGRDNGAPGLRPQYHATYYAAFVVDPDGHRLEAVCHKPE